MSIQEVNRIKNHYPPGTRIELIAMNDPYDIITLFGDNIASILSIVGILHDSVCVAA